MSIVDVSTIIIAGLAGIYVPFWLFVQKKKNDQSDKLIDKLQSLEVLLTRVDTKIEDHDRRIERLERA